MLEQFLTDYKIKSRKIFLATYFAYSSLTILLLLGELFVDLKSTTLPVMAAFTGMIILFNILAIRYPQRHIFISFLTFYTYFVVEVHFILNPHIYHAIIFWFALIPLVSLINEGLRTSLIWLFISILTNIGNLIWADNLGESFYDITIYYSPFLLAGSIFILGFMFISYLLYSLMGNAYQKVKDQHDSTIALKNELEDKRRRLENYQRSLISFSIDKVVYSQSQAELFKSVCLEANKKLNVSRVSIWLLEGNDNCINRKCLLENDNHYTDSVILKDKDFPGYFQALKNKPYILASNAAEHPDTKEFKESYLEPLGIKSMLDCPIKIDGIHIGVVCCEHQHEIKEWNVEDALYLESLTSYISLFYKNAYINDLLNDLKAANYELVDKNKEIEAMNEETHSLNEELQTLNESLEETVQERTRKLETQNKQLTEYAFINSHLLRAPLSRVLGLTQLISKEVSTTNDKKLIEALVASGNELDAIIRKISDVLYEGNDLTREDVDSIIDRNLSPLKKVR